jgi:pyruvate/2-oxoglutarate dehydrogenase complex dihydrolipoamide acyltransferase (E2) component
VETNKAKVEIAAADDGLLDEINAQEDDFVKFGAMVGVIANPIESSTSRSDLPQRRVRTAPPRAAGSALRFPS